eukprot:1154476-Pelagomonas_calceolata.AAC.1
MVKVQGCMIYRWVRSDRPLTHSLTHMVKVQGCMICRCVRSDRPSSKTKAVDWPRQVTQFQPPYAPKSCTQME